MPSSSHIFVGCRVEGAFGPLIPNPNPKQKRRIREKAYGTVIRAVDQRRWEIVADIDGEIKILTSNSLKVVPDEFGIPIYETVSQTLYFVINLFSYLLLTIYTLLTNR